MHLSAATTSSTPTQSSKQPASLLTGWPIRKWPWLASFLAALAVSVHFLPSVSTWFQLDRGALGAGQWWRLWTCHFSHWSAEQLLWNALAVWALATVVETGGEGGAGGAREGYGRRRLFWALGFAAPAIALAVLWFEPQFATYRGLSGLASTLFVILALRRWHAGDRMLAGTALVGFALKISWEAATGSTVFVGGTTDVAVLPISHIVGGLVGAVFGSKG